MKIEGCLLKYDTPNINGKIFNKDCEKNKGRDYLYPIMLGYDDDYNGIIGCVNKVFYKEDGIYFEGDINNTMSPFVEHLYPGFYANNVVCDNNTVKEMTLRSVNLQRDCPMPGCEIRKVEE